MFFYQINYSINRFELCMPYFATFSSWISLLCNHVHHWLNFQGLFSFHCCASYIAYITYISGFHGNCLFQAALLPLWTEWRPQVIPHSHNLEVWEGIYLFSLFNIYLSSLFICLWICLQIACIGVCFICLVGFVCFQNACIRESLFICLFQLCSYFRFTPLFGWCSTVARKISNMVLILQN